MTTYPVTAHSWRKITDTSLPVKLPMQDDAPKKGCLAVTSDSFTYLMS